MIQLSNIPPARRPELLLTPLGERGQYVVKDPQTGEYYTFGKHESFLLEGLGGEQDNETICAAFEERVDEPIPDRRNLHMAGHGCVQLRQEVLILQIRTLKYR